MGMNQYRYQKRTKENPKEGIDEVCKYNNQQNAYDDPKDEYQDDDYDATQNLMEFGGLEYQAMKYNQEQFRLQKEHLKSKGFVAPVIQEILVIESQSVQRQEEDLDDKNEEKLTVLQVTEFLCESSAEMTHGGLTIDEEELDMEIPDSQINTLTLLTETEEKTIISFITNDDKLESSIRKKLKLNFNKREIENIVKNDLDFEFFEFHLNCFK